MAEQTTTPTEKIQEALSKPKSVSVDGMTVQGRDIGELIEADKYLRTIEAMKKPSKGVRFTRMNSGSAVK